MKLLSRALTAAAACALLSPAVPSSAEAFEMAVQDDSAIIFGNPHLSRDRALDVGHQVGAQSVRMNLLWSRVIASNPAAKTKPQTVTYNWAHLDAAVDAVRARGMRVQLTLTTPAPAWATKDRRVGGNNPSPALFAQFAADVARHFDGRVRAISIMNEPNWPTWLKPGQKCKGKGRKRTCVNTAALQYRAIYSQSYTAIKKATPAMPVWFGELAPQHRKTTKGTAQAPLAFMRDVLCVSAKGKRDRSCGTLKTDGVAIHPYLMGKKPTVKPAHKDDLSIGALGRLDSALTRFEQTGALRNRAGGRLPVYLSEYGYLMKGSRKVSERQQADYIAQAVKLARKHPRVRQLLLYQLIDPAPQYAWHSGILRADGTAKPALGKLSAMVGTHIPRPSLPLAAR